MNGRNTPDSRLTGVAPPCTDEVTLLLLERGELKEGGWRRRLEERAPFAAACLDYRKALRPLPGDPDTRVPVLLGTPRALKSAEAGRLAAGSIPPGSRHRALTALRYPRLVPVLYPA
ncbi:MAG: hypothetical protein ACOC28_06445, partial [Alkalispirochaetaceae bacterium]